jgi:hypothetical protein
MKRNGILLTLALLIALPAPLAAQRIGFIVGVGGYPNAIASRTTHIVQPSVVPPVGNFIVPRPHRVPTAQVIQRGSGVIFIAPGNVKIAPGNERRPPAHFNALPRVHYPIDYTGVTPRPRGRRGGVQVVDPGYGGVVYGRGQGRRGSNVVVIDNYGRGATGVSPIVVGTPRADVIQYYGRPRVTILDGHSETLVFGGGTTIIIIRNGIVAVVQ